MTTAAITPAGSKLILRAVAIAFAVKPSSILSPSRERAVVWARHAFFWLLLHRGASHAQCAERTGWSLGSIYYAESRAESRAKTHPEFLRRIRHAYRLSTPKKP